MRLYHCARPNDRLSIWDHGLHGERHAPQLFAWPTQAAAEAYRREVLGNWSDIWAFEDHGRSTASVAMSAGETARTLVGDVAPQELELVYGEPLAVRPN